MLIYVDTNLFESPAQVLVNTVNTVGVMGKGIALQFKKLYPEMFREYRRYCDQGLLTVGKLWIYRTDKKWVLNFPTKRNWRQKSKLEDIELGLQKFVATYEEQGIRSIAFPQLGVGNGGLDWDSQVKPLMEKYLRKLPITIYVHIYNARKNPPEYQNIREMRQWLESQPQELSVSEFEDELLRVVKTTKIGALTFEPADGASQIAQGPGEPFMNVWREGKLSYVMSKDEVADFWMRMRDTGMVTEIDFPTAIDNSTDTSAFVLLMTQLPYIKFSQVFIGSKRMGALTVNLQQLPTDTKGSTQSASDTRLVVD